MPEEQQNKKRRKVSMRNVSFRKLNRKYDFLMKHDETGQPMLNFKLNLLNLIFVIVGMALLLIVINTFIIAFTPLREYIPGYADSNMEREVYQLNLRADSISEAMRKRDIYFSNLQRIVEGYGFENDSTARSIDVYKPLPGLPTDSIVPKKSVQDSLLRAEYEAQNQYNLFGDPTLSTPRQRGYLVKNFFVPVGGQVVKAFDPQNGHFGIDIMSDGSQIIKATLDGTVVFSSWSLQNGYCIGIQHEDSYFSTYKHNATLLKKEGEYVKAGEAIAILGSSGDEGQETHLHFELWRNGVALNPTEYVLFDNNVPNN